MSNNNDLSISEMSYEDALKQLEETVANLESGASSLDSAVALFERGQALAQHCSNLLDQAELKISQIVNDTLIEISAQS